MTIQGNEINHIVLIEFLMKEFQTMMFIQKP